MASLTQIGAVIGISGSKQYMNDLKKLTQYTKEFAAENEKLATTFTKGVKTMQTVNQQRKVLQDQIKATTNVLNREKEELEKLNAKKREGAALTQEEANKFSALQTDINKTTAELNRLNNEMDDLPADNFIGKLDLIKQNLANNNSELKQWGDLFKGVGETMTKYVTLPIVAGVTASVKAAADWESAFAGVKKTNDEIVDENGNVTYSYTMLEDELKSIGLTTASSLTDIAGVAEVLGQLGFATDEIGEATEYVIQLADSTNLAAEEGASYVATILNLMNHGLPITSEQVNQLGSALVYLGNNYNTTESDIAAMAARLAPAAQQLNFTTADVLALSTALSEAKITAEGGGTAMTQVITNITNQLAAFRTGADSTMERIAEISGMTAEEFADAWETKPIEALDAFITGLSQLDENGEYTSIVFDELGMSGVRQSLSLNALAATHEHLSSAIEDSNREYEKGEALSDEASKRYSTLDSQIQQFKNSLAILGDSFGRIILPYITQFVDKITNMIVWFSNLDESTKKIILTIAGIVAAIGPVLAVAGQILTLISSLSVVATTLGVTIGALVAPIGIVVASIAGMIAAGVLLIKHWDDIKATFELLGMIVQEVGRKIGEFLKNLAISILEGLLSLFENIVAKFLLFTGSTLPNFANSIKTIFTNLIESAWNWGTDLVNNIIGGIKSKFSALVDSVKNIANTIWSYLHFSEPEVGALSDFNTWMPDMMKGLAKGIDDNIYLVDNAISRVADSLASPNQVNYGGVVINLNVPQGANGQQIVDEIESELASRTIRRRAVFG